jgi:cytochrome P450
MTEVVQAERALRDRHGCLPAPRLRNQRPFGIDRIEQLLRANAESRLMETLSFHFRQTGNTLEHVLLGSSGFATIEPGNIAALLTQDKGPARNPSLQEFYADADVLLDFGIEPRRDILQPIFGDGIFTQEGPDWQYSRRTIRNQLQYKRYNSMDLFEGTVDRLIRVIRQSDSNVVDLQPLFFRTTLDITTDFLFAQSLKSLTAPGDSSRQRFADAFDVVQRRATERMRRYDIRWLGDWLAEWRRYTRAWKDLRHTTDEMLDKALGAERGSYKFAPHRGILLAISHHVQGRTALRGQALNLLPAGRDTTASLLSWTL